MLTIVRVFPHILFLVFLFCRLNLVSSSYYMTKTLNTAFLTFSPNEGFLSISYILNRFRFFNGYPSLFRFKFDGYFNAWDLDLPF